VAVRVRAKVRYRLAGRESVALRRLAVVRRGDCVKERSVRFVDGERFAVTLLIGDRQRRGRLVRFIRLVRDRHERAVDHRRASAADVRFLAVGINVLERSVVVRVVMGTATIDPLERAVVRVRS